MASTNVTTAVMTLEDFMQTYSDEGPFEWVSGEKIKMAPQVTRSSRVGFRLARRLADHVESQQLGEVFTESPFVITDAEHPNWVTGSRVPDVMFVRAERLVALANADPDWEDKPLVLVPDLAVEVISPTDRFAQISEKVESYLQDGIGLVWLVNPKQRSVTVYVPGSKQQTRLTAEDTLSGGDVIPGFEMRVADLFG